VGNNPGIFGFQFIFSSYGMNDPEISGKKRKKFSSLDRRATAAPKII
jgi:hypothetical protein